MQIRLDEDRWDMAEDTPLLEILAVVSDRASAKQSLVTGLSIGGQPVSDRDLEPAILGRPVKDCGAIEARSEPVAAILRKARATLGQFGAVLKADGAGIVATLRSGRSRFDQLDAWLGLLAEYLEAEEAMRLHGISAPSPSEGSLSKWVEALLHARAADDPVRVADLLEYELLEMLKERSETVGDVHEPERV